MKTLDYIKTIKISFGCCIAFFIAEVFRYHNHSSQHFKYEKGYFSRCRKASSLLFHRCICRNIIFSVFKLFSA